MELLALLSKRDDITIPHVKEALKKYNVYPLKTIGELKELYNNIPLSLFLIDTLSYRLSSLDVFLRELDEDTVILITPEKLNNFAMNDLPSSVYECIDIGSVKDELPGIVERALERQRFKKELRLLRQTPPISTKSDIKQFPNGRHLEEKVLINFAKMLSASFDMRKLFNHFMDSIMGIVPVNKMSIMLRGEEGFYIKVHHGLDPYLAENLRLKKDSALVTWLARTGRIMQKPQSPTDSASINIKSEMELLQCSFSFPLLYKGKLIGIFNIDNKITDEPFYKEELETIYMFCNYLAVAVKDINLYHQMWYQREFTKNILSSMNSGVIVIDKEEKITIFNQQASEILKLKPSEIVGRDLRNLPSPLGDILYETMVVGTSYRRYEVEVGPPKIPLGINSFRLKDKNQNPIGAAIVFTDLTSSKKLEEEKTKAERLEAINNIIAKIAHEFRTPLTSIQTYTQILSEKYSSDKELQEFFGSAVIQSIHKLDSLIDKLVIFSSKSDYNLAREDVNLLLTESAEYISKNIPSEYKFLNQGVESSAFIHADKKLLIKALYYLIMCIVERAEKDKYITMSGKVIMQNPPYVEISIKYNGKEITDEEKQALLKPVLDIDSLDTGLNMPISKKIIEGHNGSIDIKSEDGTNTFVISLPTIDRRKTKNPV
jgi:PAS domain S-box-containing protein